MAGWGIVRANVFDGTYPPLTIDNPASAVVTEAPGDLHVVYIGSGLWGAATVPRVHESIIAAGGRRRRWDTIITATAGTADLYGSRQGIAIWGATPGRVETSEYLTLHVMRYASGGLRRMQSQWRTSNIYDAYVWTDADLPIALRIEEVVRFDSGDPQYRYTCQWKKNVATVADLLDPAGWISVADTGLRAAGYWDVKFVGTCHWYNPSVATDYAGFWTEAYDEDGPSVGNVSPADGDTNVSGYAHIAFDVTDDVGINAAAQTIVVDGVTAWSAEAEQNGFTVVRTAISGGHHFDVTAPSRWVALSAHAWATHSEDLAGNTSDDSFTFTVAAVVLFTASPTVVSTAGGQEITLSGEFPVGVVLPTSIGGLPCYGGEGSGYSPISDGATMRVISPPGPAGLFQLSVLYAGHLHSLPMTVVERPRKGKTFSIRACFPPCVGVGARRLDQDEG